MRDRDSTSRLCGTAAGSLPNSTSLSVAAAAASHPPVVTIAPSQRRSSSTAESVSAAAAAAGLERGFQPYLRVSGSSSSTGIPPSSTPSAASGTSSVAGAGWSDHQVLMAQLYSGMMNGMASPYANNSAAGAAAVAAANYQTQQLAAMASASASGGAAAAGDSATAAAAALWYQRLVQQATAAAAGVAADASGAPGGVPWQRAAAAAQQQQQQAVATAAAAAAQMEMLQQYMLAFQQQQQQQAAATAMMQGLMAQQQAVGGAPGPSALFGLGTPAAAAAAAAAGHPAALLAAAAGGGLAGAELRRQNSLGDTRKNAPSAPPPPPQSEPAVAAAVLDLSQQGGGCAKSKAKLYRPFEDSPPRSVTPPSSQGAKHWRQDQHHQSQQRQPKEDRNDHSICALTATANKTGSNGSSDISKRSAKKKDSTLTVTASSDSQDSTNFLTLSSSTLSPETVNELRKVARKRRLGALRCTCEWNVTDCVCLFTVDVDSQLNLKRRRFKSEPDGLTGDQDILDELDNEFLVDPPYALSDALCRGQNFLEKERFLRAMALQPLSHQAKRERDGRQRRVDLFVERLRLRALLHSLSPTHATATHANELVKKTSTAEATSIDAIVNATASDNDGSFNARDFHASVLKMSSWVDEPTTATTGDSSSNDVLPPSGDGSLVKSSVTQNFMPPSQVSTADVT